MRNLSSLLAHRKPTDQRPVESPRRGTEKGSAEPKPAPRKRCLNEAAHKLDR
ncbi:MAG TPA: hypothetical protein VFN87_04305 [Solirubrobacteraceae bacterium]|nr:hypothetical protein [Solirubrobacteraceae bacterium]